MISILLSFYFKMTLRRLSGDAKALWEMWPQRRREGVTNDVADTKAITGHVRPLRCRARRLWPAGAERRAANAPLFISVGEAARAPIGWVEFCDETCRECETKPSTPRDVVLIAEGLEGPRAHQQLGQRPTSSR